MKKNNDSYYTIKYTTTIEGIRWMITIMLTIYYEIDNSRVGLEWGSRDQIYWSPWWRAASLSRTFSVFATEA